MSKLKIIFISLIIFLGILLYPYGSAEPIQYIDRSSGEIMIEKVSGEYWLNWLYNNPIGELSLYAFVKRKALSEWYGNKMDSPESVDKIAGFIEDYNIDMSIVKKQEFNSFNEFFYRELLVNARPIDTNQNILVSPADGKVFAYDNIDKQDFIVKGYRFNLNEYLQDSALSKLYTGGSLIIVRLCPTDYHRFHFPVSGVIIGDTNINGFLYSVSPIATKKNIKAFCMNKRTHTMLRNKQIGDIIISEVGATMVGSIFQTYKAESIRKGDEKGYFKFGGSTVIMIFRKGKLQIDKDLLENTKRSLETAVLMGEGLGVAR